MTDFERMAFKTFDGTTLRGNFFQAEGDETPALVIEEGEASRSDWQGARRVAGIRGRLPVGALFGIGIEEGGESGMRYVYKTMKSPVGTLKLVGSEAGLAAILWERDDPRRVPLEAGSEDENHPALIETERQLNEYFAGKRETFSVKLDFAGTPFQKKVWRAMLGIPFGETRTYGELAGQIGDPKAVRAVGAANGRNPIAIIGPCHRVIGASGKLTGYAGGLEAKAALLRLEGVEVGETGTRKRGAEAGGVAPERMVISRYYPHRATRGRTTPARRRGRPKGARVKGVRAAAKGSRARSPNDHRNRHVDHSFVPDTTHEAGASR